MATTNLVKTINENEIVFADGEVETFENIDQLANYALDNFLDVRKFTETTPFTIALNRVICDRIARHYDYRQEEMVEDFKDYVDRLQKMGEEYYAKPHVWAFYSIFKLIVSIKKGSTCTTHYDYFEDMQKEIKETGTFNGKTPEAINIFQLEQALRYNVVNWRFENPVIVK